MTSSHPSARRARRERSSLGALSGLLLAAGAAGACQAAVGASTSGPRDLEGVWFGYGNQDPKNGSFLQMDGSAPPFTAEGRAILDRRKAAADAGNPIRQPADDCIPHGVPGVVRLPTPLQIIQTPGQVTILYEASRNVRLIYMDEPQPAHVTPTFMGHSVGRWKGDTLVVDTVGQRANWLDVTGAPAGAGRQVTERLKKISGGKELEDVVTISDPQMYAHPWTTRRTYEWRPKERVEEYVCEESLRVEPGAKHATYN